MEFEPEPLNPYEAQEQKTEESKMRCLTLRSNAVKAFVIASDKSDTHILNIAHGVTVALSEMEAVRLTNKFIEEYGRETLLASVNETIDEYRTNMQELLTSIHESTGLTEQDFSEDPTLWELVQKSENLIAGAKILRKYVRKYWPKDKKLKYRRNSDDD